MSQRTHDTSQGRTRRATFVPSESDTRLPRQFLESLMQVWVRDAFLLKDGPGAGQLRTLAAEVSEFGCSDIERAHVLFQQAAQHFDADPRSFAGLRRFARGDGDAESLFEAYEQELEVASDPRQRMLSVLGTATMQLRAGTPAGAVLSTLHEVIDAIEDAPVELVQVYRSIMEDALVAAGRVDQSLHARIQRWGELRLLDEEVAERYAAAGALGIAIAAEVLSDDMEKALDWYGVAFEADQTEVAVRPLLRACYAQQDWAGAEAMTAEVARRADDPNVRKRFEYELGMLRAYRLDDRPGGLQALGESVKGGATSPLAAAAFLALARSSHGSVVPDEFVDALGTRLDFAASGVERADLLTQMATHFDRDLDMTDAAIELAREALDESPSFAPAVRLLGHIYSRDGHWNALAELGEAELTREDDDAERVRAHERLADLYETRLHDPTAAERHLRSALGLRAHLPVVRRLARLLADQYRWDAMYEHLRESALRVSLRREKLYLLEQAAEVADNRLREPTLAIEVYRALLDLQPEHPGAIASLGRLLAQMERWTELVELNEFELGLTPDDIQARVAILCRSAEICVRHLGDLSEAEDLYQRALEEDCTCDEALRGLGSILKSQNRWDEIIEMTEREMAAAQTDSHRFRCLRQLGEMYAVHTEDPERAIQCFEELSRNAEFAREEALVWLERLYEATGEHQRRLETLAARMESASADPLSTARISYRIAEILEWNLDAGARAFDYYIESLADSLTAPAAFIALDRLWDHDGLDDEIRTAAIRCALDCADTRPPEIRRQALTFVAERADALISDEERVGVWVAIAKGWPQDPKANEFCAMVALQRGEIATAERYRAVEPTGPVEVSRAHWAMLDAGGDRDALPLVDATVMSHVAGFLARESGSMEGDFDGFDDRQLFGQLGQGMLSLRDLRGGGPSEARKRLGILASRALGDDEAVQQHWFELAGELSPPIRALRAWLDLTAEEEVTDEQRGGWLREAAKLGCYDEPIREDLYVAFQGARDLQGLEMAIADHLSLAPPESHTAASLANRRARCLELLGRSDEAIAALRYAAIHAPADAGVALEKARLETLMDELDGARETLEACLDAGCEGDGRIELLGRIADLHQMEGGQRQRAISALEDAFLLSGHDREWALRLASAHAGFGSPQRCVELLESALTTPPTQDEIRHWQLLARVYGNQLSMPDRAEEILWDLFRAYPGRRTTLSGLEEFYRNHHGATMFADRLSALLAEDRLDIPKDQQGELWTYVGELQFAVLRRYREAEVAFENARRITGPQAKTMLREAKAAGKQPGKLRPAVVKVVEALGMPEADERIWEEAAMELEQLYQELQDTARLSVSRQVRLALGANVEAPHERVKRDPTRELEPALTWKLIGGKLFDEADLDVLRGSAPLAEKVFSRQAPNRKAHRGRRLKSDEYAAFDAFVEMNCTWLGVSRPKISVGEGEAGAQAFDGGHFWVPSERIHDDEPLRARFWAGYVAGLVFTGLAPYTWVGDEITRELLRAVAIRGMNFDFPEGSLLEDEVGGLLMTPLRRQAAQALRENVEVLEKSETKWASNAMAFADRAGLVACGDAAVAVEEVLYAGGWHGDLASPKTRARVIADDRSRNLLLYSLSDDYYLTRYESGLGQRPWLFD